MQYDCIIIGAGPSGLTAAAILARDGKRVLMLDKARRPGTKLLIAGGGKGNVTNRHVEITDFIGESPGFAEYALSRCPSTSVIAALEEAGVALEERTHGRIFCQTSAKAVLNELLARLPQQFCSLATGLAVTAITQSSAHRPGMTGGIFTVSLGATSATAPRLIMATGSPAWPACGADDSGLSLAKSLGHAIVPPRPVLVPLVMPGSWPLRGLAGISCDVRISCDEPGSPVFQDSLLFTHRGISGPAALQISCYWRKGSRLDIDFLPDMDVRALLDAAQGKATPRSVLGPLLPDRLLLALLPTATTIRRVAELSRKQRNDIAHAIHQHSAFPLRTEGFVKAEAASGGVATRHVDPLTMQSLLVPGLFFCGEILDITGRLGGYNLHWAWASGIVAGESAAL